MSRKVMLGFKRRFLPFVWLGTKRHTIRMRRIIRPEAGDNIRAYADSRQKTMAIVGSWECTKVEDIVIERDGNIFLSGSKLDADERDLLCWRDGFRAPTVLTEESLLRIGAAGSHQLFMGYWNAEAKADPKREYPFRGDLIHWRFDLAGRAPLAHVPQIVALCPNCKWFGGNVTYENTRLKVSGLVVEFPDGRSVNYRSTAEVEQVTTYAKTLRPACPACGSLLDDPPKVRVLQDLLNTEIAKASRKGHRP